MPVVEMVPVCHQRIKPQWRSGRKGGKATAKNRSVKERQEAGRKAVLARWAKEKKES